MISYGWTITALCHFYQYLRKFFKKIIFNEIYFFLKGKTSQFNPISFFYHLIQVQVSCLIITQDFFFLFDCNSFLEVCSIFLDISKAFDKVWHERWLCKRKSFRISRNLPNLIKHYWTDRFQRVFLNGQCSNCQPVLSRVAQESILET